MHRLYLFIQEKSILEWIAAICTGLFLVAGIVSFIITLITRDTYSFDITFPHDTDLEMRFYNTVIPLDIQEEKEFNTHTDTVKSLEITDYKVKTGETISEIASAFRLNIDTIISYNNIKSVRKIYPGMNLLIPNTDGIKYTVRKGDCLSLIANKFGISLNSLLDWNNVSSSVINAGDVLYIPGARMNRFELRKVMGTLFIFPAKGRLSSKYGWRNHPISEKRHFHNGIDIANSPGTRINASMGGRIQKIGYNHIYGKYVIIRHENGFQTFYGHLRKVTVEQGNHAAQGKKIGEMGSTGYSTGNHLHFSIYKNGETVDPLTYLK